MNKEHSWTRKPGQPRGLNLITCSNENCTKVQDWNDDENCPRLSYERRNLTPIPQATLDGHTQPSLDNNLTRE